MMLPEVFSVMLCFIYFVSLIRFCEVNCRLLQEMVNHVYFYYLLPIISVLNISVSKAFIKLLKKSLFSISNVTFFQQHQPKCYFTKQFLSKTSFSAFLEI